MDKLLPAIDWLKKNSFWVGCSILSLAMIGTWFWTTMQIAEQTEKNASDVKSQIQAADNIMKVSAEEGAAAHPNSSTEAGMKAELNEALEEIVAAWELRYNAQKQFLKWPVDVIGDDKFVSVFSQFEPAEKFPDNFDKGLGLERYLELYRITIPKQMVKICKELGTNWQYDPDKITDDAASTARSGFDDDEDEGDEEDTGMGSRGGLGGMGGGMRGGLGGSPGSGSTVTNAAEDLNKYAVIWNAENQAMWNRKLTDFMGKDNHTLSVPAPTPLQVYSLQQDLWLLEAMFRVIKSVNGTANANDLASIKEIDHIAFGREARTQLGELTPFDPRLAGIDLVVEGSDMGEPGDMSEEDAGDEDDETTDDGFNTLSFKPYHGRYVNPNFEPLHADTVRDVLRSTEMPEDNLELIVAKRVPFRIALKMDERKIPEFLAACANSPFSFEINQIRLNRHVPNEGIVFNGGGTAKIIRPA